MVFENMITTLKSSHPSNESDLIFDESTSTGIFLTSMWLIQYFCNWSLGIHFFSFTGSATSIVSVHLALVPEASIDGVWCLNSHTIAGFELHSATPMQFTSVSWYESKYIELLIYDKVASPVPDSKVHGANMGPIWGLQDPGGPHVGLMNLALWDVNAEKVYKFYLIWNTILYDLQTFVIDLWLKLNRNNNLEFKLHNIMAPIPTSYPM